MGKSVKYVPLWHVTHNGKTYSPAGPGQLIKTIEGLSESEIKRLLDMGAIEKFVFDEGESEPGEQGAQGPEGAPGVLGDNVEKPLADMSMNELRTVAKDLGVPAPVGITKPDLLQAIWDATKGQA